MMGSKHNVEKVERGTRLKKYMPGMNSTHRVALLITALSAFFPLLAKAATPLAISQFPLELAVPTHPQVLFAIGNSESMDGTLSGAIMVGSGSLARGFSSLPNSSSPLNYDVPSGFTPPKLPANASGQALYTANVGGTLYDNGPSRLNVAKAGVRAILDAFMQNTDFALETYSTSSTGLYTTWVYYMSPTGSGFTFINSPSDSYRYVTNPCYGYTTTSTTPPTVYNNCASLATLYTSATLSGNQYIQISTSSDDANINDVLYAGGQPGFL